MRSAWIFLTVAGLAACSSDTGGATSSTTAAAPPTSATPSTVAVSTTAAATTTTTIPVATTAPASSVPPTTVGPRQALAGLADPSGRVVVIAAGDARVVRGTEPERTGPVAVVDAAGAVTVLPTELGPVEQAVRQGGSVLLLSRPNRLDRFVLADRRLERVALDLPAGRRVSLVPAGEAVVVAYSDEQEPTEENGRTTVPRMAVIAGDGRVRAASAPPDPWAVPVPGAVTVWTGVELVTYAADSMPEAGGLRHPVAYDPAADTWRTLSDPPWANCGDGCVWYAPHQGGDRQAIGWTGNRTLVRTGLGGEELVALHDVAGDRWERLPAPPIALSDVWVEASPSRVVLFSRYEFPGTTPGRTLGTAAVLDLATRTWSTTAFASPEGDLAGTYLCPVRLAAVLYVGPCDVSDPASATVAPVVLDVASGAWSPATQAQQLEARAAGPVVALEDLLAALAAA